MTQSIGTGWGQYVDFGYETTFGTDSSTYPRSFGHGAKITINRTNSSERVYALGNRNAQATVAKQYEGKATVEFLLNNATFLRGIFGAVADAGAGPYTHTYTEANVVPSITISTGSELGTNDEVTKLLGCKFDSLTLTAAVGELVKCRTEVFYKTETLATSGIGSQVAEADSPFSFAQGVLQLPSGTTIGNVQSIEITVNNTLEKVFGLGSRFPSATVEKNREYNLRMTVAFSDTTVLLTKFLGASGNPIAGTPAESATLVLTFTNGLSSTDERTIAITLANIHLNEETLPKDINEITKEDVTGWARSGTSVVWTNNTASDSATP